VIEEKLDYLIREVADLKQMQKDQLEYFKRSLPLNGESIQEFKNVDSNFKDLVSQGFNTNVIDTRREPMRREILTLKEACEYMNCSRSTIYKYMENEPDFPAFQEAPGCKLYFCGCRAESLGYEASQKREK